jgi:hypothetical protein
MGRENKKCKCTSCACSKADFAAAGYVMGFDPYEDKDSGGSATITFIMDDKVMSTPEEIEEFKRKWNEGRTKEYIDANSRAKE